MAKKQINRYFVDIRLSNKSNHRKSVHIDACSRTGAIYQTILLLKEHKIDDIYAIIVREYAYPIAKRKRIKALKEKNKKNICEKDNLKAIESIKIGLKNAV